MTQQQSPEAKHKATCEKMARNAANQVIAYANKKGVSARKIITAWPDDSKIADSIDNILKAKADFKFTEPAVVILITWQGNTENGYWLLVQPFAESLGDVAVHLKRFRKRVYAEINDIDSGDLDNERTIIDWM